MELKYGSTSFQLKLPPERLAGVIEPAIDLPAESSGEVIGAALDGCEPILSGFAPEDRVVIVTSDITRYTGSEIYLPLLVERLNRLGIPDRNIEITDRSRHPPQTDAP